MRSALIKFQAWRLDRKKRALHRSLQWWERERVKGKTQFVVRTALTYGLSIVGINDVFNNLFNSGSEYPNFCLMALFWP
jgi:hypothetical protein